MALETEMITHSEKLNVIAGGITNECGPILKLASIGANVCISYYET